MPEGFSSVADLKVIVDANAEKFHSGLQGVMAAVDAVGLRGSDSFSGLQRIVDTFGGAVLGTSGKIKLLLAGLEGGLALYQQLASQGREVAEVLGATAQYDKLKASIDGLGLSIKDAAVGAFFAAQGAAEATSAGMVNFASTTDMATNASDGFAQKLIDGVANALDLVQLKLRLANAENTATVGDADRTIAVIDKRTEKLKRDLQEIEQSGRTQYIRGIGAVSTDEQAAAITAELNALYAARNRELERRNELDAQTLKNLSLLDYTPILNREIEQLERRNATLGMSSDKAAEYLARLQAIDEFWRANGRAPNGDEQATIDARAFRIGQLTGASESARKAEQEQKNQDRLQESQARSEKSIFANAERQVLAIEARGRAVTMNARAAAELAAEEQLLLNLKTAGIPIDEKRLEQVQHWVQRIGEATEASEEYRQRTQDIQAVTQTFSSAMSSAFAQWTSGAKLSVKDMVASILSDLAQLTFRRSVLEPLFGGGSTQGGGALGGFLGSLFSGARADGGPVEAGRSYLVGERGPEMFVPGANGAIVPNGGGASGPTVQIVTQIDARGATPDAIQQLRQEMAARDARLPGEVTAIVQQGRSRGIT